MEFNQTENTGEQSTSLDLLNDEEILLNQFEYASTGQRFLNWLIDNLLMRFGVSYLSGFAIGIILVMTDSTAILNNMREMSFEFLLVSYLLGIINYSIYYIVCEKLFNGYTLGKIITGTKAIRDDGKPLTMKDVLLRTVCRFVPFEVFSGFKIRAWHDEWSNTMVIKAR